MARRRANSPQRRTAATSAAAAASSTTWAAANLPMARRRSSGGGTTAAAAGTSNNLATTIEAGLHRCDRTYEQAMECWGALSQADTAAAAAASTESATSADAPPPVQTHLVRQLAQLARSSLQDLLADPLLVSYAKMWRAGVQEQQQQQQQRGTPVSTWLAGVILNPRAGGSRFSRRLQHHQLNLSPTQQRTIQHLAYLALLNYADLLWVGLVLTDSISDGDNMQQCWWWGTRLRTVDTSCWTTTIDQEIEQLMPSAGEEEATNVQEQHQHHQEATLQTLHLAVWAYIDATALDGSDPLVWAKLATVVQRLALEKRYVDNGGDDTTSLSYRRLQGYAWEQAILACGSRPRPRIVQAYKNWYQQHYGPKDDVSRLLSYRKLPSSTTTTSVIALPRYSWAVLGRLVWRAAAAATTMSPATTTSSSTHSSAPSGNILVQLQLSPLLAVVHCWPNIVSSLSPADCRSLALTCRTAHKEVQVAMDAAKRLADKGVVPQAAPEEELALATLPIDTNETTTTENDGTGIATNAVTTAPLVPPSSTASSSISSPTPGSRVSKRVRSQKLTSDKRAERSQRRASLTYCVYAVVLGETPPSLSDGEEAAASSRRAGSTALVRSSTTSNVTSQKNNYTTVAVAPRDAQRQQASERLSQGSLFAFCQSNQIVASAPLSLLLAFLAHVSVFADPVFGGDHHGTLLLLAAVSDGLELAWNRTIPTHRGLIPAFSAGLLPPAGMEADQLWAVDLLQAELRFKRCDREDQQLKHHTLLSDFDSDTHIVERLTPVILGELYKSTPRTTIPLSQWQALWVRYHWLVAGYFLWRSRLSHDVAESRQAEQEGLACIEDAIQLMQQYNLIKISTPHLEGVGRSGEIWKELSVESLTAFQNKVQASSVVLKAQENFLDAVTMLSGDNDSLDENEAGRFVDIANYLLERYSSPVHSHESNYFELIDDFIGVHGTVLLSSSLNESGEEMRIWFHSLVPTDSVDRELLQHLEDPCILSILVSCMQLGTHTTELYQLFLNLIRTLVQRQRQLLESSGGGATFEEANRQQDTTSDDDFSMMSDDEGVDSGSTSTLKVYALLIGLLVESVERVFITSDESYQRTIQSSTGISETMEDVVSFCLDHPPSRAREDSGVDVEMTVTQFVLERMESLHSALSCGPDKLSLHLRSLYLKGLGSMLLHQERALQTLLKVSDHQKTGSIWITQMKMLTKEIGYVCLCVGSVTSANLFTMKDGKIFPSQLIILSGLSIERIASVLLILQKLSTEKIKNVPLEQNLVVPVAAGLIGFCGSAACSDSKKNILSLSEFVDSDESAADWIGEEDDEEEINLEQSLRVITQLVHLAQLTFMGIEEQQVLSCPGFQGYITPHGPILPLVSCRVLGLCSDLLLEEFRGDDSSVGSNAGLYSDYSVGTRKIGSLLDSILYKGFKCIYGFNLSSSGDKDKDGLQSTVTENSFADFSPETVRATAQLFRCVMRATSFGRKSPPKTALDTIQSALPPAVDSSRAVQMRNVLFNTSKDKFTLLGLSSAVQKADSFQAYFSDVAELLKAPSDKTEDVDSDECNLVRQGLAHVVAQGALPVYQDSPESDVRAETVAVELELKRKFQAILFELGEGNIANVQNWVKAAQCCWAKSEMIADRIGTQNDFAKCSDFVVKGRIKNLPMGVTLSDLLDEQEREEKLRLVGWTETIGQDLSMFMNHCWSSFSSLKDFSRSLEKQFRSFSGSSEDSSDFIKTYEEITRLYREQKYGVWQQVWGGLFVSSLRVLARRCMSVALYVSYAGPEKADDRLSAEICESLGTYMYSDVSGSQIYGYPMRSSTAVWKRDHADFALKFYEHAMALQKNPDGRKDKAVSADWDLIFMIGKCHEKIASTFFAEHFSTTNEDGVSVHRRYEHNMRLALQAYSDSLQHGLVLEKEGALGVDQQGGSGHGATEVQYRLHATRLKCIVRSLKYHESERGSAEQECLRLVEQHWFSKTPLVSSGDVRNRTWNVLVDIVDAMIQCRTDFSCFHRSVYRHAQALLWAPIVSDPTQPDGSFGSVPGSQAYKLRGLNSESPVESAAPVIGSLFDRRRAQLCAVWVTQTAAEPFELINMAVRKYDSLRGKYCAAYLQILEIMHRKNDIESFWRWISAATRDLPSYMQMTAGSGSNKSSERRKTHTNDSLLLSTRPFTFHYFLADVKRKTNASLASVILHEVRNLKANSKTSEGHLKQIYSCFLRLNCESYQLQKNHVRKSSSVKPVLDGLISIYTEFSANANEQAPKLAMGDWSIGAQSRTLDLALAKCRELFPSLSNNFLSSKKTVTSKKRGTPTDSESATQQVFRVEVPEGVSEGESFFADIMVGETIKRIKLTVPGGGAKTLRFTLTVPKENEGPSGKQQKTIE